MKLTLRPLFTLSALSAFAFFLVAGCGDSSSGDDGGASDKRFRLKPEA